MVSTWSSGTGMAGVAGSLGYAGLTAVMSVRNTVISLVVVPILMGVRSEKWMIRSPCDV